MGRQGNIGSAEDHRLHGRSVDHGRAAGQDRAACRDVGRDPTTIAITALIGLWFPDLQPERPAFFDNPLTGTAPELAAAMRGYEELGASHVIFQYAPYTPDALRLLTEALHLYRQPQW